MATDIDPTVKHPLYTEYEEEWLLNTDIAEMRHATLRDGTYLDRFGSGSDKAEATSQYNIRKQMSLQSDIASSLIEMRVAELWRKNPGRQFADSRYKDIIEAFLADVDNGGTTMNTFMKRVTEKMHVNGVDVLVDSNVPAIEPLSAADENNTPFLSAFSPLARYDWSTDHAGRYWWVRYALGEEPTTEEGFAVSERTKRFVTYSRDSVTTYAVDMDGTPEAVITTHNMEQVPVVQVYWGHSIHDDQPAIATSLMSQLSPISRYMLNLISQGQLDLYMTVAFFVATGVTADEVNPEFAASCIKAFTNPDADLRPIFANVDHIIEKRAWLDYFTLQMLRIGKVTGLNAATEGRASSGVQVAVEASPLHSELSSTAGVLETADIEIMRLLVSRKIGKPITTEELGYTATYNRTYTLQSVKSLIDEAVALSKVEGIEDVPLLMQVLLRKVLSASAREGSPEHDKALKQLERFVGESVDTDIGSPGDESDPAESDEV